jgi:hypothetical protein
MQTTKLVFICALFLVACSPPPVAPWHTRTPQATAVSTSPFVRVETVAPLSSATPHVRPTLHPAASSLPIFDTHAHYSRNSWSEHSPGDILVKLENAGVARALISSSPDEGTRRLYELDPVRVVPGLRPYHDDVGTTTWETSDKTLPYLDERIDEPMYVAFGEIHVHFENIESPIFQSALKRALDRNLVLHIHSYAEEIRAVFELEPDAKILWAHAGFETPEGVSVMLDEYPNLWTDISIREYSIAPDGTLLDDWRALFLKHPDRITIGTDTWIPERWTSYQSIIERDRIWLNQLPSAVAEQIAYGNAVKLFGAGGASELVE